MAFSGLGAGTWGNPYQITTAGQLQEMQNSPSAHYILMNDIDWSTIGFPPSDYTKYNFYGTLRGKGHTIRNLTGNAMFMWCFDGMVKDVIFENCAMTGAACSCTANYGSGFRLYNICILNSTFDGGNTGYDLAPLVGILQSNSIATNCHAYNCETTGDEEVGGLVGTMRSGSTLYYCSSSGTVSGDNDCGGIIGNCESCESCESNITHASDCWSSCEVNASLSIAGGFVGEYYTLQVYRCYSYGAVSSPWFAGGFSSTAGYGKASASNCYWDTQTSGQAASDLGTGKTTAQMMQQATYNNYDFVATWIMDELNSGYPYLKTNILCQFEDEEENPCKFIFTSEGSFHVTNKL